MNPIENYKMQAHQEVEILAAFIGKNDKSENGFLEQLEATDDAITKLDNFLRSATLDYIVKYNPSAEEIEELYQVNIVALTVLVKRSQIPVNV